MMVARTSATRPRLGRAPTACSAILIFALALFAAASSQATSATTTLVSVSSSGAPADSDSFHPSISADGRYVAFGSAADNLVPGDTNVRQDVFVRDTATGRTRRASVNSSGVEADRDSWNPSISADGRYVAFTSFAWNLAPGEIIGIPEIYVHDMQSGKTALVSQSSDGVPGNYDADNASISADGRFVAFSSDATNLTPLRTRTRRNEFVRDLKTGTTEQVNVSTAGRAGNGDCHNPSISADGRYVAFQSSASNLVPGTRTEWEIYVRDRVKDRTILVSQSSAGRPANDKSGDPGISADGRYVVFHSMATKLVKGDSNHTWDVFRRDLAGGPTIRVSVDSAEKQANGPSRYSSISKHGGYIAFDSEATNLVKGDTNGVSDAFVRDLRRGKTSRVSLSSAGKQGNKEVDASEIGPSISADARFVAFDSAATNLVPGDTKGAWDVFLRGPLR